MYMPEVDAAKAVQKPNLVPGFIHKRPQFGPRSDTESSKSFQEPQPSAQGPFWTDEGRQIGAAMLHMA
ncbi:hypothetical protein CK227_00330 [Mesorhizobium sp. WSM4308]|nr:hypothetical protein CK232_04635 [Mesorhizobium sp. WSM4304]PBB77049.1 hypothetical protein CK227_00330 [Mesorhizobium sp. WSM4308]